MSENLQDEINRLRRLSDTIDTIRAENQRLREVIRNIISNAVAVPDIAMSGGADCYAVPLEDIEIACAALSSTKTDGGAR